MRKIYLDEKTAIDAMISLSWMIRHMEWASEQSGLDTAPSPELKLAIETRDKIEAEILK